MPSLDYGLEICKYCCGMECCIKLGQFCEAMRTPFHLLTRTQEVRKNVDKASVAELLARVAWPDSEKDEPPWAFVFNGHNGPGDSMLVLRALESGSGDGGGDNPSLLVIHVQSKKREASQKQQAANWGRIQIEAQKIPLFTEEIRRRSGGDSTSVQQVLLYVSDEGVPRISGNRLGGGLSSVPKHWSRDQVDSLAPDSGNELKYLEQGAALTSDNGLLVCAVFHNTQWHLRGATQLLKTLLERATRKMIDVDASR